MCTTPPGLTLNSTVFVPSGEASTGTNAATHPNMSRNDKVAALFKLFWVAISSSSDVCVCVCVAVNGTRETGIPVECWCRHIKRQMPSITSRRQNKCEKDKCLDSIVVKLYNTGYCNLEINLLQYWQTKVWVHKSLDLTLPLIAARCRPFSTNSIQVPIT